MNEDRLAEVEPGVVRLRIVESSHSPGKVSLRPVYRHHDSEYVRSLLTAAGFRAGDIVEIRRPREIRVSPERDW